MTTSSCCPDGDISIKLLENHWVQIRSGRSNTKMVGMARANYPQVPEFPSVATTSISAIALKTLIARTIFAISNEESRYTLNGALMVLKAESIAMVATDGHRLSWVEKAGETLEGISGEKRDSDPAQGPRGTAPVARGFRCRSPWSLPTMSTPCSSAWAIAR